ncbi:MAG: winged helix-turn-helix transcriptional regulator [Candidatus Marsarchaeota archaeon]|nr:winged helix-turn-helix transcriptional regulator [Candidatus Marsarchaeota archaeon]
MCSRVILKLLVFFLFFLNFIAAATVYGFVYDINLNPARGYEVTVNSTPVQTIILNDSGFYSFQLPTGFFVLSVYPPTAPENLTVQNLTITTNGSFEVDLLAFDFPLPNASIDVLSNLSNVTSSFGNLSKSFGSSVGNNFSNNSFSRPPPQFFPFDFLIALILAIFVVSVGVLFILLRRQKPAESNGMVVLTGDEKVVLDKIKELEGRTSQKDLRKNLSLSESAVSIALASLEDKGLIVKIKKGRGNIIKIK